MSRLIHLIYASAATDTPSDAALEAILAKSRHNNARDGITGMLLYSEGCFFQVLEGEAQAVDSAFARIDGDPRHRGTTCIIREPIASLSFREWTMGYTGASAVTLAAIPGLNDFFGARQCLQQLDAGRARKLLQAFGAGRWRTRLTMPVALPSEQLVSSR
jgi:hypothetical protein